MVMELKKLTRDNRRLLNKVKAYWSGENVGKRSEYLAEISSDSVKINRTIENTLDFIEQAFEIAFGDDAINKGYTSEEVLQKLQDFSDDALRYEEKKYDNWK